MIIDANDLVLLPEFSSQDVTQLQQNLDALEILIRKYTNNNFQNRSIRFSAESTGKKIKGVHPFVKVGDTLQISESLANDGLYVVTELGDDFTMVDQDLNPVDYNLVTKIIYPLDVKQGIINIMKWEVENRNKVGVKAETISRHSVTYFDLDANQVMGYPVSLLGFLESYKKARF